MTVDNWHLLSQIPAGHGAVLSLHFIKCDIRACLGHRLHLNFRCFSADIYTRLILHRLLPQLQRVIYIDADVLINMDIAALYDLELGSCALAAVGIAAGSGAAPHDQAAIAGHLLQQGAYIAQVPGFAAYPNTYEYYTRYMRIPAAQLSGCFGVALLILDLQRCAAALEDRLPRLLGRRFVLPDTDILNIIFHGQALLLGPQYATPPDQTLAYLRRHGHLPEIIHFVGIPKPDRAMGSTPAHCAFWQQLSRTALFYPALGRFVERRCQEMAATLRSEHARHDAQLQRTLQELRLQIDQMHGPRPAAAAGQPPHAAE